MRDLRPEEREREFALDEIKREREIERGWRGQLGQRSYLKGWDGLECDRWNIAQRLVDAFPSQ